jgi:hypothetical protein
MGDAAQDKEPFMSVRSRVSAFALACGLASLVQPAFAMQEPGSGAASTPASVIVFDQKLNGSDVKVSYVYAPEKSFAVVYGSDQSGKLSAKALGSVALDPGDHRDVKVPLTEQVKSGDALWVSLYRAKGDGATFDSANAISYWTNESLPSTNGFVAR